MGVDLYQREKLSIHLQDEGQNLSNILELIDFEGLFSGNAVGLSRSGMVRLITMF